MCVCVTLQLEHNGLRQLLTQAEGDMVHLHTHDKCMFTEQPDRCTNSEWIDAKSADVPEHALSCCHCTFVL